MLKINGTTITMTRGDTARIEVQMQYENDTPYMAYYGDVIRFTVKKNYDDSRPLIVKDIMARQDDSEDALTIVDSVELHIAPEDTRDLPYGQYKYDIQLLRVNGDIDTFIDRGTLILTEEVGRYTDSGLNGGIVG